MKNSIFITSTSINDPRTPGAIINLDIHEIDGGCIGISPNYSEEVANYIINPYQDCQFVKLTDPIGNDDEIDPPLEEDEVFGLLKIIKGLDETLSLLQQAERDIIINGIAKRAGLTSDKISVLFGMVKDTLDFAALAEFTRILREDKSE